MNERAMKAKAEEVLRRVAKDVFPPVPVPPRAPIGHVLKSWPQQFDEVISWGRTYEIRKDDRDYQPGDTVVLVKFDPATGQHTGEVCVRGVGSVMRGEFMPPGYCAFSLTEPGPTLANVPMAAAATGPYKGLR